MAATTDLEQIEFGDTQPTDTPDLIRFAGEVLHSTWDDDFVDWKYFQNPVGRFYGRTARRGKQPLGFYGNIPLRLKLGDEIRTAAQAVDAMIAPEARRLGLFVQLNQQTYAQMDADGVVLDYALPNPISEAGFVKRLGWLPVGHIPRYVKILNYQGLPESIRHGGAKGLAFRASLQALSLAHRRSSPGMDTQIKIRHVDEFDARVDHLWRQVAASFPICVQRDRIYLNWRYAQNPQGYHQLFIAEREGDLAGYAVLSLKDLSSNRAAALAEWLVHPGNVAAGRALLAQVELAASQQACAQIQCWMLPQYQFYTRLLIDCGFLYIDQNHSASRLIPNFVQYSTPFIIRPLPGHAFTIDPAHLNHWYLTMGDHDYY